MIEVPDPKYGKTSTWQDYFPVPPGNDCGRPVWSGRDWCVRRLGRLGPAWRCILGCQRRAATE
jgi:hypothetical protein